MFNALLLPISFDFKLSSFKFMHKSGFVGNFLTLIADERGVQSNEQLHKGKGKGEKEE